MAIVKNHQKVPVLVCGIMVNPEASVHVPDFKWALAKELEVIAMLLKLELLEDVTPKASAEVVQFAEKKPRRARARKAKVKAEEGGESASQADEPVAEVTADGDKEAE